MQHMTDQWVALRSQQDSKGVTMRLIRPDDATLIHQMHQRLSPDSIYYRYLQPRIPTLDEIVAVCRLDPEKGAGLVATVPAEGGIVVGVAYYVREAQEQCPTAEPGILVEDRFQDQGIGRSLWQQMQQHAQANQIGWLRVLSHPSNRRVARLVQGSGLPYAAKTNDGLNEYLVALHEQPYPCR